MGYLQRLACTTAPARMQAHSGDPADPFYRLYGGYLPPEWYGALSAAGVSVTPDLSLSLSAMYSGVTMIAADLATLPAQVFRARDDGGKDRIRGGPTSSGVAGLAYRLRWQPNQVQTATEFMTGMVAQLLLRSVAYAEIGQALGASTFPSLLPRHPDRVQPERLPSGALRYRLLEHDGSSRMLAQEDMLAVRDLSFDGGVTCKPRVQYGAQIIGSALATQRAAAKFFKSGMTAGTVATYAGDLEPEDEAALHASISRYAAGVENSFGLMLIPDDVKVSNLAVDPERAQMMAAQEWGVREVARLLRLPGYKLGIKDSQTYASSVQAALDYIVTCLRTIAVMFEQAFHRDLIGQSQQEDHFVEFKLEALMRGDFESQSTYLERFIRSRVMRPSEARLILNMNPDAELDRLSEQDFRPGTASRSSDTANANDSPSRRQGAAFSRASLKATLLMHDSAMRCLGRECAAVGKLAVKHASDVEGWRLGLRDFYADHARYVGEKMRLHPEAARAYAAQHGIEFETLGAKNLLDKDRREAWERHEAEELLALALSNGDV